MVIFRSFLGVVLFVVIGLIAFGFLALYGCEEPADNKKTESTIIASVIPDPTMTEFMVEREKDQRETSEVVAVVIEVLIKHKRELIKRGLGIEIGEDNKTLSIWKEPKGDSISVMFVVRDNDG